MIKAPAGKVLRAWILDINPFSKTRIRRGLIDQNGLVFIPSYGWINIQGSSPVKVIGEAVEMWDLTPRFDGFWWESKAWANAAWAWCYMFHDREDRFVACRMDSEGFIFAI